MSFLKRRRYLVNHGMQIATVAYMFFVTLAVVAFHTLLAYWRVSSSVRIIGDAPLASLFAQDVVITVVFTAIFILFAGIRGSHKVAGPIYRFQQVLKRVQAGDISDQIQLRRGDMLLEFGEDFNLALANLREIVAADRMAAVEAVRLVNDIRDRTHVVEVRQKLQRAADIVAALGKKLTIEPEWQRQSGRGLEQALEARAALGVVTPAPSAAGGAPKPLSTMVVPPPARPAWIVDKTLPARPAAGGPAAGGGPGIAPYLEQAKTVPEPLPAPPLPRP
jgi:hypothetical protein